MMPALSRLCDETHQVGVGVCRFVEPLPRGLPRVLVSVGVTLTGGVGLGCGALVLGRPVDLGPTPARVVAEVGVVVPPAAPIGSSTPGALLVGPRMPGVLGAGRVAEPSSGVVSVGIAVGEPALGVPGPLSATILSATTSAAMRTRAAATSTTGATALGGRRCFAGACSATVVLHLVRGARTRRR
jgi:hypothetical protein